MIPKNQTRRSFIFGGVSIALGFAGWHWLHSSEPEAGISWPIRWVLERNGKLAQSLFSPAREPAPVKPPPAGKLPRFNGDLGIASPIDIERWRLQVLSDENVMKSFSLTELKLFPRTSTATDFKCIEGWSDRWSYAGVRFSDFMKATGLGKKSDGSYYSYVGFMTPDGEYYVSIDMPSMLHPQTVLAYEMNERPLLPRDGAPLRLIIPVKYGIKSIKRIGQIRFSDTRPPDYWAERGYDWYAGL
jgi:DMSO/TMAO reductase YedYZ molybdopterin-dependent catalytic subunit